MNLEERIANAVNEKLTDGTVEKLVSQTIEKAVSSALEDVFQYNGAGRKMLVQRLNEVMVPAIEEHDFNQYIVKLDAVLTDIINNTNLPDYKCILENFRGLMKEPEVKEIKLSEIFKQYCKYVAADVDTDDLEAYCEDEEPYYECVTANMEVEHKDKHWISSFDNCEVNFSCDQNENLNHQLRLYKQTEKDVWNVEGIDDSGVNINSLRNLNQFEVFLMTLKRAYVKVIIDVESDSDEVEPDATPEWSLD